MRRTNPPSTCAPWNPVMVKKALAKVLAVRFRPRPNAWMNSYSWPNSNPRPRTMVTIWSKKNRGRLSWASASSAKWQVTPLDSSTMVFTNGIGHQLT